MRLGVEAALLGGELVPGDVAVEDGRVTEVALTRRGTGIAVPGLVDLQVNGIAGVDLLGADADGYATAGAALAAAGVTAYLPTFVTAPEPELVEAVRAVPDDAPGPRILGAHLEGPFLSPVRLGAHDPAARLDPDPQLAVRLLAAGRVRLVTLAPELPGALDLIDLLHERGVTVSLGHSDASAREAHAAFDRSVGTVTHAFNAMRPLGHRDPGLVGAALARPDVIVQAIVDGVHLDDDVVRLLWRAKDGGLALVSDSVAAAGLGDGAFTLGGLPLVVSGGVARRADGTLAGSTSDLASAVRRLVSLDVPLALALEAASAVPAAILREAGLGRLAVGLPADIVVLDDALQVVRTVVGGVEVYRA